MKWPWQRRDETPDDERLREAERHVEELARRAEPVHSYLWRRQERNHWAEAIEAAFRRHS